MNTTVFKVEQGGCVPPKIKSNFFATNIKKYSLDPESNRGPTDYLDTLQSAALPTELSREVQFILDGARTHDLGFIRPTL